VIDAPETIVEVDRVRLEQALVNVLGNAIREGPPGSAVEAVAEVFPEPGEPPTETQDRSSSWRSIGPELARRPVSLSIHVLDRGPGVAAGVRPLLFIPFAARARGRPDGSGLGLATAAAAVRAHGGAIGYDDRPAGGASFWLRVPTTELRTPVSGEAAAGENTDPDRPTTVPGLRPVSRRSGRPRIPSRSR